MLRNRKHFFSAAGALLLAAFGTAIVTAAGQAHSGEARCEILTARKGGMVTLEGVVHARKTISGTYEFQVTSAGGSGSTNINQGGDFTARPGEPAKLGHVMLGGSGAVYEATLEVETPTGQLTCRERTGAL